MSSLKFEILATQGKARRGRLITPHGTVETPAFMPVGTLAAIKTLTPNEVRQSGTEMILANTYHLMQRPGVDVVRSLGGLHAFMGWDRGIVTDSGGFQVFSLAALRKVAEEGAVFKSHLDGTEILLSPEKVIEVQEALGPDVMMVLDVCAPSTASREEIERACALSSMWAQRSLEARKSSNALFGIVQGGLFRDLRERHAGQLSSMQFDGYAIGGLATGEQRHELHEMCAFTAELLPGGKPRYLMGVGTVEDILVAVKAGVDLFDCVLPTRNARNGQLFTSKGALNIRNSEFAKDEQPVDKGCPCYLCRKFSRAYLRHIFMAGEILAHRLATLHNLTYYQGVMAMIREAIERGECDRLREAKGARKLRFRPRPG